ncbi:MAG: DNA cytosine methyltransferase [Thermoguttaceae bacterium]|nr:DNA cytosine methyltransferase [Thermoguttaceae bacterium]
MNAISLFSGAGGMDVGVRSAGFDVRACVEIDPHCCATLRENIRREGRETAVFEGDIRAFEPSAILAGAGLKIGELDLLFGGPPCQAFSQIGKKKALEDERGLLLHQMARYAEATRPRAIMMEQVKGLLSAKDLAGKRGGVFETFVAELESLGYSVKWRVMLAADFGVPQMRERVFLVATRGTSAFQFPEPICAAPDVVARGSLLRPFATVGDALAGLAPPVVKAPGISVPEDGHFDATPARDRERIRGVPEGKNLASQTHLPKEQICGLTRKDTTKFLRLDRSRPSNTLRGGEIFFHPTEDRYLTPREYMRIHGYPDDYVLRGPIRGRSGSVKNLDQHRQVGNSVPPPLARIIAEKILEALNR